MSAVDDLQAAEDHIGMLEAELHEAVAGRASTVPDRWCRPSCEDHNHNDPADEEAEYCGCPAHGEEEKVKTEEQHNEALAITAGELRQRLEGVPDDAKLYGYIDVAGGGTTGTVTFRVQAEWNGDGSHPLRKLLSLTTSVTGGGPVR